MTDPISRRPVRPTPTRQDPRDAAKARAAAPSPPAPRVRPEPPTPTGTSGPVSADAGERRLARATRERRPTSPAAADRAAGPVPEPVLGRRGPSPVPATARADPRPSPAAADHRDARTARRPDGAPLTPEVAELADVARRTRGRDGTPAARAWDPASNDLSKGRNAHHSNTRAEMRKALEGDHNWLEGDLRVSGDGRLVMAHDGDKEADGLELQEWLAVGGASGRGLKVDVKENEAIPALLDQLDASGIPEGRIMLNVGSSALDEAGVRDVRERFPDAWLALNPRTPEGRRYRAEDLEQVAALADAAGGRIAFPVRWDLASDETIAALRPHGRVSIWTSASQGTPDDATAEAARLRARGVDGVIDLGPSSGTRDRIQQRVFDLWESGPARGARDVVGGAANVAGDVADGVRELVDDAPLIGRWL